MIHTAVERCRICGNRELVPLIDLGEQALTGVFPRARGQQVTRGPLQLVKCHGAGACGLVQLAHTFDPSEMYGANYGYRSSLNRSMVEHLRAKVQMLMRLAPPRPGDTILDIGSNDGTTLSCYPSEGLQLIGIDPTAAKFAEYYPPHVRAVPDFFSADTFLRASGGKRARIVTSIAMFYDLDRPLDFMRQVAEVLEPDGVWHFEQSYLLSMLEATSYDTICHEHVEYYALAQIQWMAERAGLRVVDVELNGVNGGSFAVTAVRASSGAQASPAVAELAAREKELAGLEPYQRFAQRVAQHRVELKKLLGTFAAEKRRIFGLGASTKGNVLLQYCGIGPADLECIAEVNPDKFGCFTPGTEIPIVSEAEAHARAPDAFLVLPWHFRSTFLRNQAEFTSRGGKLIFPLPRIEILPS